MAALGSYVRFLSRESETEAEGLEADQTLGFFIHDVSWGSDGHVGRGIYRHNTPNWKERGQEQGSIARHCQSKSFSKFCVSRPARGVGEARVGTVGVEGKGSRSVEFPVQ